MLLAEAAVQLSALLHPTLGGPVNSSRLVAARTRGLDSAPVLFFFSLAWTLPLSIVPDDASPSRLPGRHRSRSSTPTQHSLPGPSLPLSLSPSPAWIFFSLCPLRCRPRFPAARSLSHWTPIICCFRSTLLRRYHAPPSSLIRLFFYWSWRGTWPLKPITPANSNSETLE